MTLAGSPRYKAPIPSAFEILVKQSNRLVYLPALSICSCVFAMSSGYTAVAPANPQNGKTAPHHTALRPAPETLTEKCVSDLDESTTVLCGCCLCRGGNMPATPPVAEKRMFLPSERLAAALTDCGGFAASLGVSDLCIGREDMTRRVRESVSAYAAQGQWQRGLGDGGTTARREQMRYKVQGDRSTKKGRTSKGT
eukprot:2152620-Rhodomonas_salina.1